MTLASFGSTHCRVETAAKGIRYIVSNKADVAAKESFDAQTPIPCFFQRNITRDVGCSKNKLSMFDTSYKVYKIGVQRVAHVTWLVLAFV